MIVEFKFVRSDEVILNLETTSIPSTWMALFMTPLTSGPTRTGVGGCKTRGKWWSSISGEFLTHRCEMEVSMKEGWHNHES